MGVSGRPAEVWPPVIAYFCSFSGLWSCSRQAWAIGQAQHGVMSLLLDSFGQSKSKGPDSRGRSHPTSPGRICQITFSVCVCVRARACVCTCVRGAGGFWARGAGSVKKGRFLWAWLVWEGFLQEAAFTISTTSVFYKGCFFAQIQGSLNFFLKPRMAEGWLPPV